MSCCCHHKKMLDGTLSKDSTFALTEFPVAPYDPCVFCAEKHLSYAWRLSVECGYADMNRQVIIGELVAATLHLYAEHPELACFVRGIRHLVQRRREGDVDWRPLLISVDSIATRTAREISATASRDFR